jgi:hypothetical protein
MFMVLSAFWYNFSCKIMLIYYNTRLSQKFHKVNGRQPFLELGSRKKVSPLLDTFLTLCHASFLKRVLLKILCILGRF